MWILHPLNKTESFSILCGREFIVGRLKVNYGLTIEDDISISRKHAIIDITANKTLSNLDNIPHMKITDLSKFGTFVNNQRVIRFTAIKHGDTIQFGTKSCKFRVTFEPLICTSSLVSSKRSFSEKLLTLGGYHLSEWTPKCSFVVMSKIVVTIKLLSAVLAQKFVVTEDYLQDLLTAANTYTSHPTNLNDYLPKESETINDRRIIDFSPNINRTCLFTGKTFVFTNLKMYNQLTACVAMADGHSVSVECASDALLEHRDTVIMDISHDTQRQPYDDPRAEQLAAIVARKGHRRIPEHEIGFAILFVDTSEFTNPELPEIETSANQIAENLQMTTESTCSEILGNTDEREKNKDESISLISDEDELFQSSVHDNSIDEPVKIEHSPPISPQSLSVKPSLPRPLSKRRPPVRTNRKVRKNNSLLDYDIPVVDSQSDIDDVLEERSNSAGNEDARLSTGFAEIADVLTPKSPADLSACSPGDSSPGGTCETDKEQKAAAKRHLKRKASKRVNQPASAREEQISRENRFNPQQNASDARSSAAKKPCEYFVSETDNFDGANRNDESTFTDVVNETINCTEKIKSENKELFADDGNFDFVNDPQPIEDIVRDFLSARPSGSNIKRENEYKNDDAIPTSLMLVRVVDLQDNIKTPNAGNDLHNKPGQEVLWNGKYLYNFKKFQKSSVFEGIPEIIGKSELVINQSQTLISDEKMNEMMSSQSKIIDSRDFDAVFSKKNVAKLMTSKRKR